MNRLPRRDDSQRMVSDTPVVSPCSRGLKAAEHHRTQLRERSVAESVALSVSVRAFAVLDAGRRFRGNVTWAYAGALPMANAKQLVTLHHSPRYHGRRDCLVR